MKCINCGINNSLKERTKHSSKCKSCNHKFVFEPTVMSVESRLTDALFAKLTTDISAKDTLFFTPRQLYYLLERRLRSPAGILISGGFMFWASTLSR